MRIPLLLAFAACSCGATRGGDQLPKPPTPTCGGPVDAALGRECETLLTPLLNAQERGCAACSQCEECWWLTLQDEGVRRQDVHVLAIRQGESAATRLILLGATSPTHQYLVRVAFDPTDPNEDGGLLICHDTGHTALIKRPNRIPVVDVPGVTAELCWYKHAGALAICAGEWSKFSTDPVDVFARTVKYCTEESGPCCHFD